LIFLKFKLDLKDRKVKIHINDADNAREELTPKFKLTGKDRHVENGIAVIKNYIETVKIFSLLTVKNYEIKRTLV